MTQWTGSKLALHVEGLSHGPELTAVLEGLPADVHIDKGGLERFMARRAPGQGSWSTPRKEPDAVEFSSGLREVEGANNSAGAYETTGGPLKLRIANTNTRSGDYAASTLVPRPGHADYAYYMQSGHPIEPGGGAFSGRLTAPVCASGFCALEALNARGVRIHARMVEVGSASCDAAEVTPEIEAIIAEARADNDSVGGRVRVIIDGLAAGLGGGYFEGIDSALGAAFFGIPAVKAVEFGAGIEAARMRGSQNNDAFIVLSDGRVRTETNNHGGLLGGITSGMPVVATLSIKPTPSIARPQRSFNLETHKAEVLEIHGRHDPCIVPRVLPVVEAVAALVVLDALLEREAQTAAENALPSDNS